MPKASPRNLTREWIEHLPPGKIFSNGEMYSYLVEHFPQECSARGDAAHEPRYKNDARWAIQIAKRDGLVRDTGHVGQHERLAPRA